MVAAKKQKRNKSVKRENGSSAATKNDLRDVLAAMNKGFELMDRRFEAVERRFEAVERRFEAIQIDMNQRFEAVFEVLDEHTLALREHSTILDKNTKLLEGIDQERLFTEHSVQRLEKDIVSVKKHLHL